MLRFLTPLIVVFPLSTASAEIDITVDTAAQRMSVWIDGIHSRDWPVSTGAQGYETPAGVFRAFRLEREHYSKEWDNAPMPYSIFFTESGHAIHGTQNLGALGHPASHGCVRLAPDHAAELFSLVEAHGASQTRVEIVGPAGWPVGNYGGDVSSFEFIGGDRPAQFETVNRWLSTLGQ